MKFHLGNHGLKVQTPPHELGDNHPVQSKKGGLGIQRAKTKNKVLLAKLAWRATTNQDYLWAHILKDKYLTNPLNHSTPLKARLAHGKVWKDLAIGWEACRQGLKWTLGSKEKISLWYDR